MGLLIILLLSAIVSLIIVVFFFFGTDAFLETWLFWDFAAFVGLLCLNLKLGIFNQEQLFYGFNWIANIGDSGFWKWLTTPL
jgi:hypothetical protein